MKKFNKLASINKSASNNVIEQIRLELHTMRYPSSTISLHNKRVSVDFNALNRFANMQIDKQLLSVPQTFNLKRFEHIGGDNFALNLANVPENFFPSTIKSQELVVFYTSIDAACKINQITTNALHIRTNDPTTTDVDLQKIVTLANHISSNNFQLTININKTVKNARLINVETLIQCKKMTFFSCYYNGDDVALNKFLKFKQIVNDNLIFSRNINQFIEDVMDTGLEEWL